MITLQHKTSGPVEAVGILILHEIRSGNRISVTVHERSCLRMAFKNSNGTQAGLVSEGLNRHAPTLVPLSNGGVLVVGGTGDGSKREVFPLQDLLPSHSDVELKFILD